MASRSSDPRVGTRDYSEDKRRYIYAEYNRLKDQKSAAQIGVGLGIASSCFYGLMNSVWWSRLDRETRNGTNL